MKESEILAFTRRLGDFFERMSLPPIAGRVFAWLLVCDPEDQDAAQIAEAVDASSASVNAMARLLMRGGMIERRGQPGSRKHLYRIRSGAFLEVLRARMRAVSELAGLAEEGLEAVGRDGERGRRLREMHEFYSFIEREMSTVIDRYERREGE